MIMINCDDFNGKKNLTGMEDQLLSITIIMINYDDYNDNLTGMEET